MRANGAMTMVFAGVSAWAMESSTGLRWGLLEDGLPGPDLPHPFRTGLDAGWNFPLFNSVVTPVALDHDAVARKGRQDVQVQADAGLALRDVPRAHVFTLGTSQADVGVNHADPVGKFAGRAPGTEIGTGRVPAGRAAPEKGECRLPAPDLHSGLLDEDPVVGGQPIGDIVFIRPVRDLDPARIHPGKRPFGLREPGLIDLLCAPRHR